MALSNPRAFFGIHTFTPLNIDTGLPYGVLRVLGEGSLNITGELIKLNGGSNKFPWAVEPGLNTAEVTLTCREYPDFIMELFLGKAPTAVAAETSGNVSTIVNKSGTSVVSATVGIASVIVIPSTGAANLKFAKYIVKAVSATTVDVYATSNINFAQGTDADFVDDALKVTASPLTIPSTGGTVDLADFGLRFTGGSGTVAMTSGHTATFEVRPIHTGASVATFGALTDVNPDFAALVYAEKRGDGSMVEFELFRVKGTGLPIGLSEKSWSEASITAEAFYDSARGGVFSYRFVDA